MSWLEENLEGDVVCLNGSRPPLSQLQAMTEQFFLENLDQLDKSLNHMDQKGGPELFDWTFKHKNEDTEAFLIHSQAEKLYKLVKNHETVEDITVAEDKKEMVVKSKKGNLMRVILVCKYSTFWEPGPEPAIQQLEAEEEVEIIEVVQEDDAEEVPSTVKSEEAVDVKSEDVAEEPSIEIELLEEVQAILVKEDDDAVVESNEEAVELEPSEEGETAGVVEEEQVDEEEEPAEETVEEEPVNEEAVEEELVDEEPVDEDSGVVEEEQVDEEEEPVEETVKKELVDEDPVNEYSVKNTTINAFRRQRLRASKAGFIDRARSRANVEANAAATAASPRFMGNIYKLFVTPQKK